MTRSLIADKSPRTDWPAHRAAEVTKTLNPERAKGISENAAIYGAGIVAGCAYAAYSFCETKSGSIFRLADHNLWLAPLNQGWPFYIWAGILLIGVHLINLGLRQQSPCDGMKAVASCFWTLFAGAALWRHWYVVGAVVFNRTLQGAYFVGMAGAMMSLFLSLRGETRARS